MNKIIDLLRSVYVLPSARVLSIKELEDSKKLASTILSEPSLYNKIAVKWAKKIIEVKIEQNN